MQYRIGVRWNGTDRTTIATDGKMLNSYAVLLALCLGQSEVTTSPQSGFAYSDNFLVHAPTQELADEILKKSETLRLKIARVWLDRTLSTGEGACIIRVRLSSSEHHAFTWAKSRPEQQYHSVSIKASYERAVGETLAHELTHVILATEFGGKLPRWADEGIATFQNDFSLRLKDRQFLAKCSVSDRWPQLTEVLNEESLSSDEQVFFSVAHSLTEFLLEQGEIDTFFQFAMDGKKSGWEFAASKHYEFRSLRELESQWRGWAIAPSRLSHSNTKSPVPLIAKEQPSKQPIAPVSK